jgi:nucleotide-binding universal stress UspA family protein
MLPIRSILYPTDFSESSAQAYRVACSLARDYGAKLIVLHVAPPETVYSGLIAAPSPNLYHAELEKWLEHLEIAVAGIRVEHRLKEGDPAKEILGLAGEVSCDLIVMGSHGRTSLERLLVGSVAETVFRHASCPVLIVRAPLAAHTPPLV